MPIDQIIVMGGNITMNEQNKHEKIDEKIEGYTLERQPGIEGEMDPKPIFEDDEYKGSGKLKDKVVIITGGDSGIGRAVAVAYAKEGANMVIAYLDEHDDANKTKEIVESYGVKCETYAFDVKKKAECEKLVKFTIDNFRQTERAGQPRWRPVSNRRFPRYRRRPDQRNFRNKHLRHHIHVPGSTAVLGQG